MSIAALGDLPPNEHDPTEVRDAADDILSGADYDRADPEWLDEVWEWILERLNDLFGRIEIPGLGSGGGSSGISWLLMVVGAGLLIWLIVRYRRFRVPKGEEPESTVVLDPHRSADDWRSEAQRLEAAGQWREAIRAEYRALVGDLVDADLLPDIPGRTAGEYRLDVHRDLPELADPFDAATELFEPVWYSDLVPTRAGLDLMRDLAARVDPDAVDPDRTDGSASGPSEAVPS
jgi:hypothetical protein